MKEQSLIKGVVSAYDAITKKTIFSNLHNVVTVREKIRALCHLLGFSSGDIHSNNIYLDPAAVGPGGTSGGTNYDDIAAVGKIEKFRVGFISSANYPTEVDDDNGLDTGSLYTVGWFDANDSYAVSDITGDKKGKKIIYDVNGGAFIRFKLSLYGGQGSSGVNGLNISAGQSRAINLVALADTNGRILTQFRFPTITFYSNTQVDFEYRLYL